MDKKQLKRVKDCFCYLDSGFKGGFRVGRGGGGRLFFFRDSTSCQPKRSPFCTILGYPFLADQAKNFSKGVFVANIH